jgi:hypothetical protein
VYFCVFYMDILMCTLVAVNFVSDIAYRFIKWVLVAGAIIIVTSNRLWHHSWIRDGVVII